MADRFPSLEEFSAGQTDAKGEAPLDLDDSVPSNGDFLSREKAVLGDAADQFATPNDTFKGSATVEDGDDDLLGGGSGVAGDDDVKGFESSFPAIDTSNEQVAPGGTITGSQDPFPTSSYGATVEEEEEPEPIRQWRIKRDADLAIRDAASARKKEERVKRAQEQIDEFYENYNAKKEKLVAQTRREAAEFLKKRENTVSGGTSWERISKLVDLSVKPKTSAASKERFRQLLLDLKKDENAPGAKGA
ncbi:MAG: hypothetical protein M1832_002684 [Thelocarpon impressellum]|nr:MAG: hypothetical protein M1832_002684 [Thelocarpon impressellum]